MPVFLDQDISGRLTIDYTQEPDLSMNPEFDDILLAFNVVSRTPVRVFLDIPGQFMDSIDYIRRRLESMHVEVVLGRELQLLLDRFRSEMELVERIRQPNNAVTDVSEIEIPNLDASSSLLPHQVRGVRLAIKNNNLAEFSVQGSGKTAMVLSAFSVWKHQGEVEHILVIGPLSCFQPWEDEIRRCFGDLCP